MSGLRAYWLIAASIVSLFFFVKAVCIHLYHRRQAKALGCKPAFRRPGWIPFVYHAIRDLRSDDYLNTELALHRELGVSTWRANCFGASVVWTFEPDNIEAILATQFDHFQLGPSRDGAFRPLLGPGIFTMDGQDWRLSRALLRPQFVLAQISRLSMQEMHVQHLLRRLEPDIGGWTKPVDLTPLFFNLTLDSGTQLLFGESADSQLSGGKKLAAQKAAPGGQDNAGRDSSSMHDWSTFCRSFDKAKLVVSYRTLLFHLYWLCSSRSFRQDCAEVQRFADSCVQRALARMPVHPAGKSNDDSDTDDHDHDYENENGNVGSEKPRYVFLNELIKTTRDPYVLRSQLLNILVAARDTTAGLLSWAMYCLARHPDIYARLRHEILADFGAYSSHQTSHITMKALQASTYLQHVLAETLRLHPPVPSNPRYVARSTALPRGGGRDGQSPLYVRKGDYIFYSVHVMHRRQDIWGHDADEFRPDRWQDRKAGWEYLPFNGGPRICIGKQLALAEAGYVLVRLVQKYDALQNMNPPETTVKTHLCLTSSPVRTMVRMHECQK